MNNNWLLGFPLSAQQVLQQHQQSQNDNSVPGHHDNNHLGVNFNGSDQISVVTPAGGAQIYATTVDESSSTSSCFDHHLIPCLKNQLPPPNPHFPFCQPFNNTNSHHSQDWNMNSVSCSSSSSHNYLDNSSNNNNNQNSSPKLENFLGFGGHSFADQLQQHNNLICNNTCTNMYEQTQAAPAATTNNNNSSTIGLSMIKNWLRNNPEAGGSGAQTLSLSMSTGCSQSQTSSPLPLVVVGNNIAAAATEITSCTSESSKDGQSGALLESVPRKSVETFGQRTSIYRGVTRHRWTGRYEAHLWDNTCRREGQTRKGRQGGYDKEDKAARSYDLAALKYWGTTTTTNFPINNYEKEIEDMKHMTRQEYVASLRRKSSGFSRGASIYRGVTRHHQHGRWQARIGRVAGNKDLYLGTFSTQEEAAEAYDIAAIKFRGLNAVTNFEINRYDVKSIMESTNLPIGGAAKRLKDAENAENMALELHRASYNDGNGNGNGNTNAWPTIAFQQAIYPYNSHQRLWCKQEQDNNLNNNNQEMISHGNFSEINHQLQLGNNNTQNFLQPSLLMHNVMEQSSVSNAGVYGNSDSGDDRGNGFAMPMMGTVIVQDDGNDYVGNIHEGMFGSMTTTADASYQQHARNYLYYHQQSQESSSNNNCDSWNHSIPIAVPTLAARNINNVDSCNGASTFTVWNDT
ncbi:hypothetical protein MIMGU_mgv1a022420mg [Erythranthe guttata]|uniref:AP2/ERF domain-containing protein n=1 Tax=Erythranthe guttata TaxID=4155 RepID=A0A022RHN4_ERYGU|nr:hypothetical protein MIMGU_mgv1a022420mg [Erythranthe guttata]